MSDVKDLLEKLVAFQSVTPNDVGCQAYLMDYLESLGFKCASLDNAPVSNFFASFGTDSPALVFAGHTDVVAIGDASAWHTSPFVLHQDGDLLYGRGTADMKGSLACMMLAAKRFTEQNPTPTGGLGFLITSGEEGDDFDRGTPYVMEQLKKQGNLPTYCIVGEPSSTAHVGDVIKIGRRGSLTGKVTLHGKQGHVAYPYLAENPIHTISPVLLDLTTKQWDAGNAHFPPTTLQITQINAGGYGGNVIPGELTLQFNVRYSTEQTYQGLQQTIMDCFKQHGLKPSIDWRVNGEPFLTENGRLLDYAIAAVESHTRQKPMLSTTGGTSDGRFIAPYGVEVIELGPVNETIHQANECVSLTDLEKLTDIYYAICESLLA